ncbi:MAG: DUF3592 domain-containing protein [Verrucomicrobia bacterium]|nr:DUF3592 domain-containing protein [Verrucomicrobiota bacterium]
MPPSLPSAAPIVLASPADIFFRRLLRGWFTLLFALPFSILMFAAVLSWAFSSDRSIGGGIVVGLLFLVSASAWIWTLWSAVRRAQIAWVGRRTEATVVAISSDQSVKINGKHPKVLKYLFVLPASGEKIRAVSPHLRAKELKSWQVGDKLIVAYLPETPTKTVILSPLPR